MPAAVERGPHRLGSDRCHDELTGREEAVRGERASMGIGRVLRVGGELGTDRVETERLATSLFLATAQRERSIEAWRC
jgi:hypothetical protein